MTIGSGASRTVILGAGISGLTVAYALKQHHGEESEIFEQGSVVGGLCRVQEREGFRFDVVSHVLHFRSEPARKLVQDLLGENLLLVERSAWIYFRKRYIPYPFQTHLGFLPWPEKLACLVGYWRAWASRQMNGKNPPRNFEEWIHYNFGSGIARHFMVPYNSELWGMPPREMGLDWVRPFVPNGSLKETMRGLFLNGSDRIGYNSCFYYPAQGGLQPLVEGLSLKSPAAQLGRRAIEIDLEGKTVRFEDGEIVAYDRLVSTIPLDTFIRQAKGVPDGLREAARHLRCTSLLNITCCMARPLPHFYHWIYFPESEFRFFRLVFPSNVSSALAPSGCSIICAEISNPGFDRQAELEEHVKDSLLSLGMIQKKSDIAFTVRNHLSHAYPVHDLGRAARVTSLLSFLKTRGVYSIGRFGGWRYSSIDDAIVEALHTVDEATQSPRVAAAEKIKVA